MYINQMTPSRFTLWLLKLRLFPGDKQHQTKSTTSFLLTREEIQAVKVSVLVLF